MFIEVSCINLYSDSFKLSYLSLHWEICSNFYSLNLIYRVSISKEVGTFFVVKFKKGQI